MIEVARDVASGIDSETELDVCRILLARSFLIGLFVRRLFRRSFVGRPIGNRGSRAGIAR